MLPMVFSDAVGSSMQRGMAVVVVGGLLYATFMTLYVVPVMYDILYRRVPREVDLGDESIDDDPGDAQAYLEALQNAPCFGWSQAGGGQRRFGREYRNNFVTGVASAVEADSMFTPLRAVIPN